MQALARSVLPVLNVLGQLVLVFAATMLVPLTVAHFAGETALKDYDLSLLVTAALGGLLLLATRRFKRELQPRDGLLLVTLAWTVLPAVATLPLLLHLPGLGFTRAYFETMSALTTTGSTTLTGLDQLPLSINVWRHLMLWIGGLGILILVVAILPLLGMGGAQLFRAEITGPMKEARLTPRIADTAKALYSIYVGLSLLCALAYRWAGMDWADAFMHAGATLALGGMSSHDAGLAYFNSPAIEAIAVFFMFLAGFSFSAHFVALRRASVKPYFRNVEAGFYVLTLFAGCAIVAIFLYWRGVYSDVGEVLRHAVFNVVSVATTTGYASTDYNQWPIFAPVLMLFMCSFTTCAGSTGGGIKMFRAIILLKQARREMTRILHPRAMSLVVIGGQRIENRTIFAVLAFMLVYGASITGLTLLLLLSGLDVITAFSAIVACINSTGTGLNQVGPATNYANLNAFELWVCTFAMLIGRLELFSVLVLFTPEFWRR